MRTARFAALTLLVAMMACGHESPTAPTYGNLSGTWTGVSTYPNSPFHLEITHTGSMIRGQYRDELDFSPAVGGTYTDGTFALVIDFGDAKLNLTGTLVSTRRAEGHMFTSALGNRMFPFTITR